MLTNSTQYDIETEMEYADNQEPIDAAVNYATQKLGMTHITDSSQIQ